MDMQKIVIAAIVVGGAWYIYKRYQPTGSVGLDRPSTTQLQDIHTSPSSMGYGDFSGGAEERNVF